MDISLFMTAKDTEFQTDELEFSLATVFASA